MDINAAARAIGRAHARGSLAESVLGAAAEFFFSSAARTPRGSAPAAADHARQEWGPVDFFAPGVLPVVATPTPLETPLNLDAAFMGTGPAEGAAASGR
ncbi:hypothetical protein, partial [Nesterenkonia massiliensis]|uniref:hypothetical protein n=1 Tax=Nesterenkonia massiliensis TaxID=1232429 RepID=UPI0005CB204A